MDKKTVNIYIEVSIKGPARRRGRYLYILETETSRGAATFTDKKEMEDSTESRLHLQAMVSALRRIRHSCHLNLYVESTYVAAVLSQGWIEEWKYSGWQNKKGQPVKDAEKWQEISSLLSAHDFTVYLREPHSYREWMAREVQHERPITKIMMEEIKNV